MIEVAVAQIQYFAVGRGYHCLGQHFAVTEEDVRHFVPSDALNACGIDHSKYVSFLDCPVASRWTLVRAK